MRRIFRDWQESDIDRIGVSNFAQAMRGKLKAKRLAGRYGWANQDVCTVGRLKQMLRHHAKKDDMVDVGNIAMMIYNRERCMKDKP